RADDARGGGVYRSRDEGGCLRIPGQELGGPRVGRRGTTCGAWRRLHAARRSEGAGEKLREATGGSCVGARPLGVERGSEYVPFTLRLGRSAPSDVFQHTS